MTRLNLSVIVTLAGLSFVGVLCTLFIKWTHGGELSVLSNVYFISETIKQIYIKFYIGYLHQKLLGELILVRVGE
jgi:hypothetical protein